MSTVEHTLVCISILTAKSPMMGMMVLPYKTSPYLRLSKSERDDIVKTVAQKMGFDTEEEYRELYPGHYKTGSQTWYIDHELEPGEHPEDPNINGAIFFAEDATKERGLKKVINYNAAGRYDKTGEGYMLVMQPTIAEMRNVNGYRTAKMNDLWFCSDWKE